MEVQTNNKSKLSYAWDLTKGLMIVISAVAVISILGKSSELSSVEILIRLVLLLVAVIPVVFGFCYLHVLFKYESLVQRDKELEK
ncbi:hypothetical protein [Pseudoalteromonas sp. T1lg23B]|uniref:hypothetical protein n=1 Tax=Pseudoalteromonas sp. T1lg23B TaxID=2077097 RepID=UPI00131A2CDB|nr:hypothetical protein [Pseudoalteromonas sp. T1lg23B]